MANNELTASDKLSDFLVKNRALIIGLFVVLLVFVAVVVLASSISAKSTAKGIASVDAVEYAFKKDSENLSSEELSARCDEALASVEALCAKTGITGVRANMLKADLLFLKEDYESSRSAWVKAAELKKSAYTAPICYYNAAVCSENLNDLESAISYYTKSVGAEDFYLVDHAYFSLGRVNEAKGDLEGAKSAYNKLTDLHPDSKWAAVAVSRLIAIDSSEEKTE